MNILFYGPAGTGKTTELRNQYIKLKLENRLRNDVFYLVPTAEHADRIKTQVLAKINPLFTGNIMTLDDFFYAQKKYISAAEQQLILHKLCQPMDLPYFGEAKNSPVLYAGLAELIAELKNYRINPNVFLQKLACINSAKEQDLQKIFTAYNIYLTENNLQDKADVLAVYQSLENNIYLFIDGFTDFTPLQYKQIHKLAGSGKHTIQITLTYAERSFFDGQLKDTFDKLCSLGFIPKKMADYQRSTAEDLKTFALSWGEPKAHTCQNIEIISAGNRLQEIEAIAREIIQYKQKHPDVGLADIAVIFRSIGNYQFLINEVFQQYNIPVEVHEGIAVLNNPFCNWLLSLREVQTEPEILLTLMKSAYALTEKPLVYQLEFLLTEQPDQNPSVLVPELSSYIQSVLEKSQQLQKAVKFSEIKAILAEFYKENSCAETLLADKNNTEYPALKNTVLHSNRAYVSLQDTLDKLHVWQEKLELELSADQLWTIFLANLTEKTSARRRNGDQVQVYDALSARQKDYKIVFLADLTLGSWPAGTAEDLLLKDYEKEQLDLGFKRRITIIRNEDIFFYQSFTRASEKIYLCLSAKEASGKKLEPSPYLNELKKFFADIPKTEYEQPTALSDAVPLCLAEYQQSVIYRFFNKGFASYAAAEKSLAKEKDLDFVLNVLRQKNDPVKLHLFSEITRQELALLDYFSVTKLEKYSRCAFKFFCEDVLKLRGKPDKPEDKIAMTLGSLMHKVLERHYKEADQDIETLIKEIWDSVEFRNDLRHILPGQAAAERKKICFILKTFVQTDQELCRNRNFRQSDSELRITKKEKTAYQFNGNTLTGMIDRIDQNENGDFLIIDYKSSHLPGIDPKELEKGILPQALIYAFIYKNLSKKQPAGMEYASLKKNKRSGLYCSEYKNLTNTKNLITSAELNEMLKEVVGPKIEEYFAAIQNGKFPQKNDPGCCKDCAAEEICRKAQTGAPL